jgi:hypothetical protein
LKICVVQWRRKRKETESWNFFGGFEVAGVGLREWGAPWLVEWGMWRELWIKKRIVALASSSPGSAAANQASRKQPSRGVIVNVGRSDLSKIPTLTAFLFLSLF